MQKKRFRSVQWRKCYTSLISLYFNTQICRTRAWSPCAVGPCASCVDSTTLIHPASYVAQIVLSEGINFITKYICFYYVNLPGMSKLLEIGWGSPSKIGCYAAYLKATGFCFWHILHNNIVCSWKKVGIFKRTHTRSIEVWMSVTDKEFKNFPNFL